MYEERRARPRAPAATLPDLLAGICGPLRQRRFHTGQVPHKENMGSNNKYMILQQNGHVLKISL